MDESLPTMYLCIDWINGMDESLPTMDLLLIYSLSFFTLLTNGMWLLWKVRYLIMKILKHLIIFNYFLLIYTEVNVDCLKKETTEFFFEPLYFCHLMNDPWCKTYLNICSLEMGKRLYQIDWFENHDLRLKAGKRRASEFNVSHVTTV